METFVILDLETTGLDHERDQIIEIAALKVAYDGAIGEYREIGRFQTLVALEGGVELSEEITRLTGITAQMLEGASDLAGALISFSTFAGDSTVVAHNAPFDLAFISERIVFRRFICTRAMAKLLGFPKASLKDVYREVLGEEIVGHHRAMSDVNSTYIVFNLLRERAERDAIAYRNVVVDSPERALRFVPSGARVITLGNEQKGAIA